MRRLRRQQDDESAVDLTPMLDIVFIMLIFFIVTATFVRETGIDVLKPDAQTAETKQNVAILIAISENNEVFMDGRQIDLSAVQPNVQRLRAENPKGPVVIQADERADTGILVEVMDAAKLAGAPTVTISAQQE